MLDASALLALLNGERGADIVTDALPGALVSAVNLAEVAGKLRRAGMPEPAVRTALDGLSLEVRPFDAEQACVAGFLQEHSGKYGLSLGDRACLGLSRVLGIPAVTADKAWVKLAPRGSVKVIR